MSKAKFTAAAADVRRGLRLLLWGWLGVWVLCLATAPLAPEMVGRFSGAPIEIRRWMSLYNTVVLVAHLAALLPLAVGLLRARHQGVGVTSWVHRGALLCLAVAVVTSLGMLLFPLLVGSGPWPAASLEVAALRLLSFSPSVARAGAFALLVLGMARWRDLPPVPWHWALVAVAWADLVLSVLRWVTVSHAVIARLHPLYDHPWWLGVWSVAALLFALRLRRMLPSR